MTAADLARVVHASYGRRTVGRLMPTSSPLPGRARVSAHTLAQRVRIKWGLSATEEQVKVWLEELAALGVVDCDRKGGGWAVVDWSKLGEVAQAATFRPKGSPGARKSWAGDW